MSWTRQLNSMVRPLLAGFLLLALVYAWATPPLEASDEFLHYPMAWHLATSGGLPVQRAGEETLWRQEGSQPPLYYALVALLNRPLPLEDLRELLWYNPHARIGLPHAVSNKNVLIHSPDFRRSWAVVGIYLGRLLSIGLAAGTVVTTWALAGRLLEDRRLALLAAGLVAFNPMFLFIAASVNNDNLSNLLGPLGLWGAVMLLHESSPRRALAMGVLAGLGALAKVSLLGLAPLLLLAVLVRRRAGRQKRLEMLLLVAGAALVAGWWYLRNLLLYGELTGTRMMARVAGLRPEPAGLLDLAGELQGFWLSFWGVFGAFNVLGPAWAYWTYSLLALAAVAGGVALIARARRVDPRWLLLGVWPLLLLAGLTSWSAVTLASQGRLVFPALSTLAVLAAAGLGGAGATLGRSGRSGEGLGAVRRGALRATFPGRGRSADGLGAAGVRGLPVPLLIGLLAVMALLIPLLSIRPAYARPASMRAMPGGEGVRPVNATFAGEVRLLGYGLEQQPVAPGEAVPVTLYLEHTAASQRDLSLFIHAFARGGPKLGQVDSYPGGGTLPTTLWSVGEVIADRYAVPIEGSAPGPTVIDLVVGVYDPKTGEVFQPVDAPGREAGEVRMPVGRLDVPYPVVQPTIPQAVIFGGRLELVGFDDVALEARAGEVLEIRLYWRRGQPLERDYTTFVHLLGEGEQPLAQADSQPQDGRYPTSFWAEGEVVLDIKRLQLPEDLPPGTYRLAIGAYELQTGERLDPDPGADPHHRIFLPSVEVKS